MSACAKWPPTHNLVTTTIPACHPSDTSTRRTRTRHTLTHRAVSSAHTHSHIVCQMATPPPSISLAVKCSLHSPAVCMSCQFIASHNGKWPKRTIYAYFCLVCFFLLIENRALLPPYTYNAWQKITYPIHSFGDDDCLDKAFNANRRDVFSTVACGIAENCCIFLWGLKSEEFSLFFFLNLNVIWNWIFL